MENFDLNKIKNLSFNEAKLYIDKYFIPLTNREHAFYINGRYEIMDDEVIKKKVDFILKHILEVYCSSKQDSYDFLLKWFSNMVRGNRNNSALYLKGPQ